MIKSLGWLLFICISLNSQAQKSPSGKIFRISSSHSMFPDSLRNVQPRVYNGKTYTATEHYSDSSVFIFVPDYFDNTKYIDYVFWFHGWINSIDTALVQFELLEQFYAARRNAIFIFPEGPKNAPDSYGGKLEKPGEFYLLWKDVFQMLYTKKLLKRNTGIPGITLAGHSGAYKVMAKIYFQNAMMDFKNLVLFDALYGEMEAYFTFSKTHGKLINIYTDNGGTKQNSLDFLKTLDSLHIAYLHKEEDELTGEDLKANRIIFLHSKKGHNEVITNNRNFERFLL
ncbi:MAG: hypothetical protein V4722_01070 [Bacteroidota bacterium]